MVRLKLILFACAGLLSCNPRISSKHIGTFSTVEPLMRSDSSRTGFFTNASLFDTAYDQIKYVTTNGDVYIPNDGTQNFLLCRYDTATLQPIWVAVGGGSGGDAGCNYYIVPPENTVYAIGYFEDTAYFPHQAGMPGRDTLISRGGADMFVAKYAYDDGTLQWITSGGSMHTDVVFTTTDGARHQETILIVNPTSVIVYANVFGFARFGAHTVTASPSGNAVRIQFDKESGEVRDLRIATTINEDSLAY